MLADLKYGLRQFRKSPGFAITALLTLALGIGANAAIYSIIHGTLRLPFAQSDRMAAIQNVFPRGLTMRRPIRTSSSGAAGLTAFRAS